MNVYVETNFVLELVFQQEQEQSCKDILALCKSGTIRLVIPAYSLAEPHEKLFRQNRKRKEIQQFLENELKQLSRSTTYQKRLEDISNISTLLIQSNEEETQRLFEYRHQLLHIANIIPLTTTILVAALQYESTYDLTPQDAIVFSSVIHHLSEQVDPQNCFLNKNSKDFDNPDIVDALQSYNCRMIPRFVDGLQFLQSQFPR